MVVVVEPAEGVLAVALRALARPVAALERAVVRDLEAVQELAPTPAAIQIHRVRPGNAAARVQPAARTLQIPARRFRPRKTSRLANLTTQITPATPTILSTRATRQHRAPSSRPDLDAQLPANQFADLDAVVHGSPTRRRRPRSPAALNESPVNKNFRWTHSQREKGLTLTLSGSAKATHQIDGSLRTPFPARSNSFWDRNRR